MGISYKEASEQHKNEKRFSGDIGYESAPYAKKKQKKTTKRANHKHEYAECVINHTSHQGHSWYGIAKYCTICGKVYNEQIFCTEQAIETLLKTGAPQFDIESPKSFPDFVKCVPV